MQQRSYSPIHFLLWKMYGSPMYIEIYHYLLAEVYDLCAGHGYFSIIYYQYYISLTLLFLFKEVELFEACYYGLVEQVHHLLTTGVHVNVTGFVSGLHNVLLYLQLLSMPQYYRRLGLQTFSSVNIVSCVLSYFFFSSVKFLLSFILSLQHTEC